MNGDRMGIGVEFKPLSNCGKIKASG